MGVDLGTANTLVHIKGEGVVLDEPTVVTVSRSNNEILAVGSEAKAMIGRTPAGIDAVRPLKSGVIADVDVAEAMLRSFLKKVTAQRTIKMKPRVVVGVPSGITDLERRAVGAAAQAAGAREVFMVAEPIAAAIGTGHHIDQPKSSMVIDIGGGTTEIAVIALNGIVSDSSIRIGGDALDQAIISHIRSNFRLAIGEPTAERLKIELGSVVPTEGEGTASVHGKDTASGYPRSVEVAAKDVRECFRGPIESILIAVNRALDNTPPELASDIVDEGITITGGGALLRGIGELIAETTGVPVKLDPEPKLSVVHGTARILEDLNRFRPVLMDWSTVPGRIG